MADFPYSVVWLHLTSSLLILSGCHASVDSALSSPLHITGCTLWLLSRDLITRAPGGRAPPMDRRVADSGSAGLSDTASYTARPPFALSLSLESRRQAERNRELMWRCNDIISYWDDKYRHTGRVTIPFKLLCHRSHIGNSFLYHCRILIIWDHIAKKLETFDFRTWNGTLISSNDVLGWQLDNTYLQNIAKGTTDPRVEFCLQKFKHKSWSSESRPRFNFITSTKHQQQNIVHSLHSFYTGFFPMQTTFLLL